MHFYTLCLSTPVSHNRLVKMQFEIYKNRTKAKGHFLFLVTMATGFHVKEQTALNIKSGQTETAQGNATQASVFMCQYLFSPSGWYEGDRLRDGERGWFLSECAQPITCQATIERNMQRMDRLQGLETNV